MTEQPKSSSARHFLLSKYQGVLCTHSVDMPGYPFGSVVPYCLNRAGEVVILISDIAQHTKNILADPKVSMITTEGYADDQQTTGRLTYIADAIRLNQDDVDTPERYYRYFPQSRDYHKTHGFYFYVLKCVRIRFIGGFGQIYWIDKEKFLKPNPFDADEEQQMLDHMNSDHDDAIKHYCNCYAINIDGGQEPEMVGIDSEGFHLRVGARIHRIHFEKPVNNAGEVRQALVALAKRELN